MPQLTKNEQYRLLYKSIYALNATDRVISIEHVKCVLKSRLLYVALTIIEIFMHLYGYIGQEHHLVRKKNILIHFDTRFTLNS